MSPTAALLRMPGLRAVAPANTLRCTTPEAVADREVFAQGQTRADEVLTEAMALEVLSRARCSLALEDVAAVCALVTAARRIAAERGRFIPEPSLPRLRDLCEQLATTPPTSEPKSGADILDEFMGLALSSVGMSVRDDYGAISLRLPRDFDARLRRLQSPGAERADRLLAELAQRGVGPV